MKLSKIISLVIFCIYAISTNISHARSFDNMGSDITKLGNIKHGMYDEKGKKLEEPDTSRNITIDELRKFLSEKFKPMLVRRKVGNIRLFNDKYFVQITEASGDPFYTMILDAKTGRQIRYSLDWKDVSASIPPDIEKDADLRK